MPARPILITGASGQLGHALATSAPAAGLPARAVGRPGFDFDAPETIAATLADAARHGTPHPDIIPISTADWPIPARRPADSRLDTTKLSQTFALALAFPHWKGATARIDPAILAQDSVS